MSIEPLSPRGTNSLELTSEFIYKASWLFFFGHRGFTDITR